jgi:chromosomal replication initiator protein
MAVREKLRERTGAAAFEKWFACLKFISEDATEVTLGVPDLMHQYWLEDNFLPVLGGTITEVLGGTRGLRLCPMEADAMPAVEDHGTHSSSHHSGAHDERRFAKTMMGSGLNMRFSFDTFVVGPNCSYSCAVSKAVADKPGKTYNPLFLHGQAGLGKTHLMQAIGQEIVREKPRKVVRYVTSETFTNEYIDALRHGGISSFRDRYRKLDVLLVDDIHFFAGKDSTQEEFFHTFNELSNSHKQIVLASDRPPSQIPNLENRLVSRFEWGLATQIEAPPLETRIAILRQKMMDWTVRVPDWVLDFLGERIHINVRRLEGALMRVAAHVSLGGAELSREFLESLLSDIMDDTQKRSISIDYIQKIVAEHFDIRLADMTSRQRPRSIALPRQIAMYLAREMTPSSLKDIGYAFGGKDHGTVIHACKSISAKMAAEDFRRTLATLTEKIKKI